ncbi:MULTISPECIES: phosphoenolpyruvate--protein phosphotransferase [Corynebacterium]|uniref:phosphoenolpyruvate--protein phosphotransferase n=2 Tax=Corynebacteriaceae TaxID=1653 RepID=UPI0011AB5FFF|nr:MULTISPECIES: phosphoenolpyruvate--protein phosphotransferase [Corynebacterium]MDN6705650.1 phosphoenolpyruvate--protein phosphotransferase [Corynebacterium glyciniphilum]
MADTKTSAPSSDGEPVALKGKSVVPGTVFAPVTWVTDRPELPGPDKTVAEGERESEFEAFTRAVDTVSGRLSARAATVEGNARQVLEATVAIAKDRAWAKKVRKSVNAGQTNVYAVKQATDDFVEMFLKAGGVMAERVTDLMDVRDRVIAELRGEPEPGIPDVDSPHVLFADDLAPADTATLDPELIVAVVTEKGGATSHTAIIARQLDIPCIVAIGSNLRSIAAETEVLVDAAMGTVETGVDPADVEKRVTAAAELASKVRGWHGPAETADGHRVQLLANVQDGAAARQAAESVAEGIGLFRTELGFLSETTEPSVEEQADRYAEVLSAFPEGKVVIRTLDAGSDKPVPYVMAESEENPALGVRGLRIARTNQELLERQLDGIALALKKSGREESSAQTWVMAPMVATVYEAQWFAALCHERGLVAGAMIEVPAAALMADKMMPYLDFVSIGTNDLTQYTMAADRMSASLAHLTDPWQPAVLRLVHTTCRAGAVTRTAVGVCGEAAADPMLACVLAGLGVTSLSAAPPALAAVGAQLGEIDFAVCREMAAAALDADGAEEAKTAAAAVLGL